MLWGWVMRRRDFIRVIAGSAAILPLAARAQQGSRRIGYLAFRSPVAADEAFVRGLAELGWVEGRNITIERRFAAGEIKRLQRDAAELVDLKVDLIVAAASAATRAARDASASIPIVFAASGDPIGQGFVENLARPGGNATGASFDASPDITTKQAQLLIEIVPTTARLAVLWNPATAFLHLYWNSLQAAAPALRVRLQSLEVRSADEFERAFESIARERADSLIVLADFFTTFHRTALVALAAKHRLPALYGHSQYTEAGGLMSYGPSLMDIYRRAATFADKILRGARPPELPVEQPTKFELVLNLKTARSLGLAIPPALIARADAVIE